MGHDRGIRTDRAAPLATRPSPVPVYGIWSREVGPLLSLGMLSASARAWRDGALGQWYEIRRPETTESFLDDLARRAGPAVLLCSNYVWSIENNLRAAAEARQINGDLLIVHGGPSTPTYDEDIAHFFGQHGDVADVLAHGEGETTVCELLHALVASGAFDPDLDRCAETALRDMIKLIGETAGLSAEDAYTRCSLAADLRVTQTVNGNKGIHCMLAKEHVEGVPPPHAAPPSRGRLKKR